MSIIFCFIVIGGWTLYQGQIPLKPYAHVWIYTCTLFFLPGTILYLYVKSIIRKTKKFKKTDLLHFLPFILNIIYLIPFISLPVETQQAILYEIIVNDGDDQKSLMTIISHNINIILQALTWAIYSILTIRIIYKFEKENKDWVLKNKDLFFWIKSIVILNTSSLIAIMLLFIFTKNVYQFGLLIAIPEIFFMLGTIILLMFNPQIFYGLKRIRTEYPEEKSSKSLEIPIGKIEEYKIIINNLIEKELFFLKKNYSIKEMSADCDIPLHHLSYIINSEFGTNYNNLINNLRVDYIIKNKNNPDWANFTLEGIGREAGFNSRNTFFKAFKTSTGKTPSEFFKQVESTWSNED